MNRVSLQHHGVIYPQVGAVSGHHALAANWIDLPPQFNIPGGLESWRKSLEPLAEQNVCLFISSEELSRAAPQRVDMATLASLFSNFDEVNVVCSLRPQIALIESYYGELLKKSESTISLPQYLDDVFNEHMAGGLFLDYNALYDHLLTGFDADTISFVSYEKEIKHPNGVIGAYLDGLGVKLPESLIANIASFRSNTSIPALQLWIASTAGASLPATQADISSIAGFLDKEFGYGQRYSVLTAIECKRIETIYQPLNDRFEKRILQYQPDFKLALQSARNADIYRNQITESVINGIRKNIGEALN